MSESQAGQRDADGESAATAEHGSADGDADDPADAAGFDRGDPGETAPVDEVEVADDLDDGDDEDGGLDDADDSDHSDDADSADDAVPDDDEDDDDEDDDDEGAGAPEDAEGGEGAATAGPGGGVGRLEREGDIAADYLEELLDIADFDGDIDLDVENDRAMVSIVGSGLGNLVGQRGATLDALQDLTRLAVLRVTGERSRLMLDIAGTRARRKEQLHQVGTEAAERARSSGEPVRLDPMTPFERKVVHDAVAAAGLRSESDGVEPNRRVVVYPS